MYEIVELYKYTCFLVLYINSGGHFHQLEINFPIKDEEEIVRNMASALDEHPNVRMAVLGNYIILFFESVPFIHDNAL